MRNFEKKIQADATGVREVGQAEGISHLAIGIATLTMGLHVSEYLWAEDARETAYDNLAANVYYQYKTISPQIAIINSILSGPAALELACRYTDSSSLIPNQKIDAGEASKIIVEVMNHGKGTAFNVNVTIESEMHGISIQKSLSVGSLDPGESEIVEFPITSDLNLSSGVSNFLIVAREKRGYDSRPVKLQIETAKLQRPNLQFAVSRLNDYTGLASGNGDSLPNNNETIEINTHIKNEGVGPALGVVAKIKDVSDGIKIIKAEDDLGTIVPFDLQKAVLAIKIPRTYSKPTINYTLVVEDIRGMKTEKEYSFPFSSKTPILSSTYRVF